MTTLTFNNVDNEKFNKFIEEALSNNNIEIEARFGVYNKQKFRPDVGENKFRRVIGILDGDINEDVTLNVINGTKIMTITDIAEIKRYCLNNKVPNSDVYFHEKVGKENLDINNYNFRISKSIENNIDDNENIRQIFNTEKKLFDRGNKLSYRYKKRYSVENGIFRYDLTIVKQGNGSTFSSSNVLNNSPEYEIEIELLNKDLDDSINIKEEFIKRIGNVIQNLQDNIFVLSVEEEENILNKYKNLVNTNMFIGADPVTLHCENIKTITTDYAVTDKADGERRMLFVVDNNGYLIDKNMGIYKIGNVYGINNNTIIDGEFLQDKNTYLSFDILFSNGEDLRNKKLKERYNELPINVSIGITNFEISYKRKIYYFHDENTTIFKRSALFWKDENRLNGKMMNQDKEYELDGLIFTPEGEYKNVSKNNRSWDEEFKWKPSNLNSIDFYVEIDTDKSTEHTIENDKMIEYRVVTLKSGISGGKLEKFRGDNPVKNNAYIANIVINDGMIKTEENELIRNGSIVEFTYDNTSKIFKWIPLRLRKDKKWPNSYRVAKDIWKNFFYPVSEEIIKGNADANCEIQTTYYKTGDISKEDQDLILPLKHFHNKYVKRKLINGVSKPGDKLLDLASGQGGDIFKWNESKLSEVVGVDVVRDNISESTNRYNIMKEKQKEKNKKDIIDIKFIHGDSSKYMRGKRIKHINSKFILDENKQDVKEFLRKKSNYFDIVSIQFALHYFFENEESIHRLMMNIVDNLKKDGYFIATFWDGVKVYQNLNKKVKGQKIYGKKSNKNIWYVEKQYDNTQLLDNLFKENIDEEDEQYLDNNTFGKLINVWNISIGENVHQEWLVNFNNLKKIALKYNLELISNNEANKFDLPSGSELFDKLFEKMDSLEMSEKKKYADARKMNKAEKQNSFMNRYVIFKKTDDLTNDKRLEYINLYE